MEFILKINHLTRDAKRIQNTLKEMGNNLVTTTGCKIYFPKHYVNGKLGSIESNIHVLGIYAIVINDSHYAVSAICAKQILTPDTINNVTIDESPYLELIFEPNSVVILGLDTIKVSPFVFNIYDELIAKGKTPWYLDYADLGSLFDSALVHAGANLQSPRAILEMLSASRARLSTDRSKYYRNSLKTQAEYDSTTPDMIPLRSVAYGATNTTAKLLGSYLSEGISSALVNPSDHVEKVESLLLM